MGLCRAGEHYPIKICANYVIGCGGDINQSDFVGLRRGLSGLETVTFSAKRSNPTQWGCSMQ